MTAEEKKKILSRIKGTTKLEDFKDVDLVIEAIFENDVETCDSDDCLLKQDQSFNIPDYLFSEIEQYVVKELTMTMQVPTDGPDDGQNTLR